MLVLARVPNSRYQCNHSLIISAFSLSYDVFLLSVFTSQTRIPDNKDYRLRTVPLEPLSQSTLRSLP